MGKTAVTVESDEIVLTEADFEPLRRIQEACYRNAVDKGFHETSFQLAAFRASLETADGVEGVDEMRNLLDSLYLAMVGNLLMLIVTEVGEAEEAIRETPPGMDFTEPRTDEKGKPVGFDSEVADIVIRAFDLCGTLGVDLASAIADKMAYNAGRERLHGGKRF